MDPHTETHPLVLQAESARLSRAAVEALAARLPTEADQVDNLLGECVDGYFARGFTTTALAALHVGVPVDARHLVRGSRLLPHPGFVGRLSAHAKGDIVGALVDALLDGRLFSDMEAAVTFLAAYWSRERGVETRRREIIRLARMCARGEYRVGGAAFLTAASEILQDDQLSLLIARLPAGMMVPVVDSWIAPFLDFALGPILDGLDGEDAPRPRTQRRAVDRIGRNEPCPCGSGKKYKRCCIAQDEERLRDSSDVVGVTLGELRLRPEEHLTPERIHELPPDELARLDPRRIDPKLHGMVLNRLILYDEFRALQDYFERVEVDDARGHAWDAVDAALRAGKPEAAKALMKVVELPDEDWLGFSHRLLTQGVESHPALDLLEAEARRVIDAPAGVDLAFDLLRSAWPSVGILLARGTAPMAAPWDQEMLLREVGLARDRLDLPALEPTEEMVDLWSAGEGYDPLATLAPSTRDVDSLEDSAVDDHAQRQLEEKEAELARIRKDLSALHRKLDERARDAKVVESDPLPAIQPAPHSDPRIDKLKERVGYLRSELSQRHSERNQLRRQLERSQERIQALEATRTDSDEPPHEDSVGADEPGEDATVALSFRFPVFSKRFRASSEALPDPVRRRAVIVASRIAAGDEGAFVGTRRLKRDRDLYRQRVGRDYRLIFRLDAHELDAIDLVPRKDLERTIREIAQH